MENIISNNISTSVSDDLNGRYLTFHIADAIYGIELFHVIEIIQIQPITYVPNVAHYIKGIINLRGKVVPVIDVRLKFGHNETEYNELTCIIVVVINDMQVGLIVDRVDEVATINQDELASPPTSSANGANKYLSNIAQIDNRIILNIDCNKFFIDDLITGNMY